MASHISIRAAIATDALDLARVHVKSWQETYRGLMNDELLDDPSLVDQRERFWTAALTDSRSSSNTVAIAILDGTVVGVAMSGPPLDDDATWTRQLYVLYTYAAVHGQGAGSALLNAVIDPGDTVGLWVADPNPIAQAFYRKHGFQPERTDKREYGIQEVLMVRRSCPHATPSGT